MPRQRPFIPQVAEASAFALQTAVRGSGPLSARAYDRMRLEKVGSDKLAGISACLIVRDEEHHLEACLLSLQGVVDQICVLDTGSVDRTVAIAEEYGAQVEHFAWCKDFSAARNASLGMAQHPWILVIDADERLTAESRGPLKLAVTQDNALAWLVYQDNVTASGELRPLAVPRLFRNDPRIRFSRPVHENIMDSLIAIGHGAPRQVDVHLLHIGYLPEALSVRDKSQRNLEIQEAQWENDPADLFNAWKLATTLLPQGDSTRPLALLEDLTDRLEKADPRLRSELPYAPLAFLRLALLLLDAGRMGESVALASRGVELFPTSPELRAVRGELDRRRGDPQRAIRQLADAVAGAADSSDAALYTSDPLAARARPAATTVRAALRLGMVDVAAAALPLAVVGAIEEEELAVRVQIASGNIVEAMLILEASLKRQEPEAAALHGEFSWSNGDPEAARRFWNKGLHCPPARNLCLAWLALADLADGDLAAAAARDFITMDSDLAATRTLTALVCEDRVVLDPGFEPEAVVSALAAQLTQMLERGAEDVVRAFARRADRLETVLPGVSGLVAGN